MTKWPSLALLSCLMASACGGGDGSDDRGSGTVPGIPIRGGERLEWDQPTDSPQTARSYTFSLYVDGSPMPMTEVLCADQRSAGGVTCSGRLPSMSRGSHRLELTASINGVESSRSGPISVSVSSLALLGVAGTTSPVPGSPTTPAGLGAVCIEADEAECYESRLLASGLGLVTSVVTTEAGLFFVEDGRRVRVVAGDSLATEEALVLDDGRRITALAVPPDFERSREVFVAWVEPARDGGEALNVTRYRELLGTLGEGATIVAGLPMRPNGTAPMAFDDRGFLYLALPAESTPTATPDIAALSNFILRFDADGGVPSANPSASPVVAHGYGRPATLLWDRVARSLWLTGTDPGLPSSVSRLVIDVVDDVRWPWRPGQVPVSAPAPSPVETPPPVLTLTTGSDPDRTQHVWLVYGAGVLSRAVLRPGQDTLRLDPVRIEGLGPVVGVSDGPGSSLIVITESEARRNVREIWQLTPSRTLRPSKFDLR